jgi:hypothetical protein
VHDVAADALAYEPGSQTLQEVNPAPAKVPGAQATHLPSTSVLPAAQGSPAASTFATATPKTAIPMPAHNAIPTSLFMGTPRVRALETRLGLRETIVTVDEFSPRAIGVARRRSAGDVAQRPIESEECLV